MKSRPYPLQQHPRFAAALSALGVATRSVALPQGASLQVVQRCGVRFASRGPVFDLDTSVEQRIAALRQARLHLLNAEMPDPALRQAGFRQTHSAASVAEMPLDRDILARLYPKWRATWRRAGDLTLTTAPFCARAWLAAAGRTCATTQRALPRPAPCADRGFCRDGARCRRGLYGNTGGYTCRSNAVLAACADRHLSPWLDIRCRAALRRASQDPDRRRPRPCRKRLLQARSGSGRYA